MVFVGECDLVLLVASTLDLRVHVRTRIRFEYSFIESAAVQIGDDVLEVSSFGSYAVNGVESAYLGGQAGRIGGDHSY